MEYARFFVFCVFILIIIVALTRGSSFGVVGV
jgi:hypothetical protein